MDNQYKNVLIGYIQTDKQKPDRKYLSIQNVSDQPITIEPAGKMFLNMTPLFIKEKHPKVPDFSKSVKVEPMTPKQEDQLVTDMPF